MSTSKFLFAATAVTLVLSGCGGGTSTGSSTAASTTAAAQSPTGAATPSSTVAAPVTVASVNASEPAAGVVSHLDSGSGAQNAVTATPSEQRMRALAVSSTSTTVANLSYTFDSAFTTLAPGWWINWWGSAAPSYLAARETRAAYINGGAASQMFTLNSVASDGGANLVYTYAFTQGTNYTIAITARSDAPTRVRFQFRLDAAPYTEVTSQTVTIGTGWQTVNLKGAYPWAGAGSVRVIPEDLGTALYIGNMSITPAAADATITKSVRSNALNLPVQGSTAVALTTVKYTSMDEVFPEFATGWTFNAFSGTSQGTFAVSRETRADHVYAGASSMKFQVLDKKGGDVHLIAPYPFTRGKTYHATFYARADEATPITAAIRVDAPPWDNVSVSSLTLGTSWQRIDLEGAYDGDAIGSVRIAFGNPTATIWVDELTISEVSKNDMAPFSNQTIPDTLFGMHINQLGVHHKWPGLGSKIVRLWDTGTSWREIKPNAGAWDFTTGGGQRLDMYVNYVLKNDPQANIIYTMGQTPLWASSTPGVQGLYGFGAGGPPANIDDWRDYVRTLARRYAGRIHHWELWNEADYLPFWNGTQADLVKLAQVAKEEILAADPTNKLVGPGFTAQQGNSGLEQFLTAGGGQFIDMVAFHWYYTTNPESIGPLVDNVRNIMANHGIGDKPLWNTEGAFLCNGATMDCSSGLTQPSADDSVSVNARALFIMADKGIQNFNYYYWETTDAFGKLVQSDFTTPTPSATAMAEARSWISGASVVDAYRIDTTAYVMRFTRGSSTFVILWSGSANTTVAIPASWGVTTAKVLSGAQTTIPTSGQIKIGTTPVLLTP